DYIYFGQMLTYGWNETRPHEDVPSTIKRSSGRLDETDWGNHIHRAPAYYQSKVMGVAHFNSIVNLVAYSKPKDETDTDLKAAYPNMTAIDFAGHNDNTWAIGMVSSGSGASGTPLFYPPLLDDDGLQSITNRDETSNLLVYAPAETSESGYANEQTYNVLTNYFTEPEYSDYYDEHDSYRRVDTAPSTMVFGHLVQNNYTATNDHLLVDKNDFNCPLGYTFTNGNRMWYQRTPDLFVSLNKGWETVSLPFTAELVSTQDKGEITHFYSGSQTGENGVKIGHEYWLREYKGVSSTANSVVTATFNYPTASGENKQVDNTFLWDYYYSKNSRQDANTDIYQQYYKDSREHTAYPLLATATPYIVGFPSKTYYEFDLSGEWTAQNTATTTPAQLDKQVISFVSEPNITIAISDDELTASAVDGYTFIPNYMSKTVNGYLMNADGDSFDITDAGTTVPFRPYFIAASQSGAKQNKNAARSIIFTNNETSFSFGNDKNPSEGDVVDESILINVHRRKITVTSSLQQEAEVRIVNTAGLNVSVFTIQPGETIETNVNHSGVYIVQADGGRYQKKVAVK
ncbi:MAG: T9SS type A sorting domain-containing protein, partial [Paludibacteraceae bacterium]|nr:T9SS type A sorting domain-containing protein [Paludibacteraceae bacterium]